MSEKAVTPNLPGMEPKFIQISTCCRDRILFIHALDETGQVWRKESDEPYRWYKLTMERKND